METRTIDDLLADLSEEIAFADPLRFLARVSDHVRTVFRKIGYDYIADQHIDRFGVENNLLHLPAYVLNVEDLSFDGHRWEGFEMEPAMQSPGTLSFYRQKIPHALRLPNLNTGVVYMRYLGLAKDSQNRAVIPYEANEAVFKYCLSELLGGQIQHPRYAERYALKQEAERLIPESRVALAPISDARRRHERHAATPLRVTGADWEESGTGYCMPGSLGDAGAGSVIPPIC